MRARIDLPKMGEPPEAVESLLSRVADVALRQRTRRFLEILTELPVGSRVLDLGCGNGFMGHGNLRAGLGHRYVGLDPDSRALHSALSSGLDAPLVRGEGCSLPFAAQSFDCVLLSEVLEHVPDEAALLNDAGRVLRPGGELLVTVPCSSYPFLWDPVNRTLEWIGGGPVRSGFWAGIWAGHLRLYAPQELLRVLEGAGFIIDRIEPLTGYCLPFNHNIVHLGARLLYSGNLPGRTGEALDRFRPSPGRPPLGARVALAVCATVDRLNEKHPRPRAGVGLFARCMRTESRPPWPHRLRVVAMAALGEGLSGSDRIFIELARRWDRAGIPVRIHVWEEGRAMCQRNGLPPETVETWPAFRYGRGMVASYLGRTFQGVRAMRRQRGIGVETIVYSASDFWPDVFPAWAAKRRFGCSWVAGFYMFAPPPLRGFARAHRRGWGWPRLRDLAYWISEAVVRPLIERKADVVLVTSEPDRERFIRRGLPPERVVTVRGGVDISLADAVPEPPEKQYDAVFIGRLHVQKGARELLEIWARVLRQRPGARLAIIGNGPLEDELPRRARALGMEAEIEFLGFLDGAPKFAVVKGTKLVVHPAVYDSGGMAACEAFACGLPGISFDLPALRSYYPRGMLNVPIGDLDAFAEAIVGLLEDHEGRLALGREARALAMEWDWDRRAEEILDQIRRGIEASRAR